MQARLRPTDALGFTVRPCLAHSRSLAWAPHRQPSTRPPAQGSAPRLTPCRGLLQLAVTPVTAPVPPGAFPVSPKPSARPPPLFLLSKLNPFNRYHESYSHGAGIIPFRREAKGKGG